jgi:hypothetical protein
MLQALDTLIIRCLESFSHWTQRTCGLKSDTWERVGYLVSAVFALHSHIHWLFFLYLALLLLFSFDRDKPQIKNGDGIALNPEKFKYTKFRPACAILAVFCIPMDISHLSFWYEFLILGRYFGACDDLPPGISKLKQMIRSVRITFRLAPAKVGA